ncbi:dihydrodipicolinate synthase family protein [Georgenia subflava]|uniref:DUF993 family protein n=1 Tax=Georgenia subflava TaxID=1622177 RepID=A0A6N7EJN5_9MICO|nr:dihydrodipicolinate synthase family protein [Georgenia subflava]MPV38602.1 DUF993 family protein [Georgenia subflava]
MTARIRLAGPGGSTQDHVLTGPAEPLPTRLEPATSRVAYSAAHVVLDPLADASPVTAPAIDWEATLRFRHHVWDLGLGVADAMDTAQRGMGLPLESAHELIRRSAAEATARGARVACGAGTDRLVPGVATVEDVVEAYLEETAFIEDSGAEVILMASRALAAAARGPEDYLAVYGRVLEQASGPVILHWHGAVFDPQLQGYWGSDDLDRATETVVELIAANREKVAGIKISLLDEQREIDLRRRLPAGVRMFTGDDFNYPNLIKGDEHSASDALLGIFDPIAPVAAAALQALDGGDVDRYDELFAPTVPLARKVFEAPTFHYKTGVVFLAYLRGFQDHFRMVGGLEGARSVAHLSELFRLADRAGLLADPDLAVQRMLPVLALNGIDGRI